MYSKDRNINYLTKAFMNLGCKRKEGRPLLIGTISNGSYTKSFPQNHYSVGLIQLTRAGGSPVLNPTIATLDIAAMVRTRFAGTKLTIDIPVSGRYAVALYSQNGQRVKSLYQDGPGKKEVSLKGLSAGAYILECVGRTGITTRQIMVGTGR